MAISRSSQSMLLDLLHHQEADQHEGRHGRLGGDRLHQRREQDGDQEENAGDDRGQAGSRPLSHARGGLDVGGVGRDAAEAARDGGDGVDDQDPLGLRRHAVVVEQAGLGADRRSSCPSCRRSRRAAA